MARPLKAEIDLDALRHNFDIAAGLAPDSRSMAVIKADAYGHGALACARALTPKAPAFGVASIEEARALREAGIETPLLLLEGIFEARELEIVDSLDLWQVIHSDWQIEALFAYTPRRALTVWLKLDSGMHRLGFSPEAFPSRWRQLSRATDRVANLHLISHFASADHGDTQQFDAQQETVVRLGRALDAPLCVANSPATLVKPQSHGAWNRPGVMLYGVNPVDPSVAASPLESLRPVMTLRSKLIAIQAVDGGEPVGYGGRFCTGRATRIGVVAAGYGDGYDRHAPDGTPVLVDGRRCRLAGRVSMDMLTVDLSDHPDARVGSDVTLWGHGLPVDEVAKHCDTIAYTLLTGLLPRVPRHYWQGSTGETLAEREH
ncbi:alanine racemase [Salinicola aestuarinus]|uniref:alanine racemase n=1 Tax=Salinicola aestuarinus TaxID=1949082 RepID=UPI000DA11E31|nr:alanine racemase [Salinicola aestuarinus]